MKKKSAENYYIYFRWPDKEENENLLLKRNGNNLVRTASDVEMYVKLYEKVLDMLIETRTELMQIKPFWEKGWQNLDEKYEQNRF